MIPHGLVDGRCLEQSAAHIISSHLASCTHFAPWPGQLLGILGEEHTTPRPSCSSRGEDGRMGRTLNATGGERHFICCCLVRLSFLFYFLFFCPFFISPSTWTYIFFFISTAAPLAVSPHQRIHLAGTRFDSLHTVRQVLSIFLD